MADDGAGGTSARIRGLLRRGWDKARSPAGIYLLGASLGRVGGFLLIPVYTRRLSPAEYGTYALFISILALLPSIFSLGLNSGLAKAYFDEKDDEAGAKAFGSVARGLFGLAFAWVGVGVGVALLLPESWLAPLSRWHAVLLVVGALGAAASNTTECFFRIRERAVLAAAFPLATFVLTALLAIALVVGFGRGVNGAVEAPALAAVMVGGCSILYVLARVERGPVVSATRRALVYSIPFVAHYVAYWVQSAGDRWVISLFTSSAALGTYYLAVQLMSPVMMVVQSWSQSIWPPMGRTYRDEGLPALKASVGKYQRTAVYIAVGTVVLIHLALPLLTLAIGPKFLGALKLMPWLGLILILDSIYYPTQNVIYYAGRSKWIPLVASTTTFGGLGIAALLVPRLGVPGLLIGRTVASTVAVTAFVLIARWVTDAGSRTQGADAESAAVDAVRG